MSLYLAYALLLSCYILTFLPSTIAQSPAYVDLYTDPKCSNGFVTSSSVPFDTCYLTQALGSITTEDDQCGEGTIAVKAFQDTGCNSQLSGFTISGTFNIVKGVTGSCWDNPDKSHFFAIKVSCSGSGSAPVNSPSSQSIPSTSIILASSIAQSTPIVSTSDLSQSVPITSASSTTQSSTACAQDSSACGTGCCATSPTDFASTSPASMTTSAFSSTSSPSRSASTDYTTPNNMETFPSTTSLTSSTFSTASSTSTIVPSGASGLSESDKINIGVGVGVGLGVGVPTVLISRWTLYRGLRKDRRKMMPILS